MADGPHLNDKFPIRESLSPPVVASPIYECAETVYITGFVPHALVRIYAAANELLSEGTPPFGFAEMPLHRSLTPGESITATQMVGSITSHHSNTPVIVKPLPEDAVRTQKPDVSDELYECGIVVPVGNLVPSTSVHVTEDGTEIGVAAVATSWHAVVTKALDADREVSAQEIACERSNHKLVGPWADPVKVKPAPSPMPEPSVDMSSLIVGNDTVTLTDLLVGAGVEIHDGSTTVCSGWYATGKRTWFPISTPLTSSSKISTNQELCGNISKPSDPVMPTSRLKAPTVVGPICQGARQVVVRNTVVNAIVVVFRNGSQIAYGGSGPGDVMLGLTGSSLVAGDVVTALQYMGSTISPISNSITVVSRLSEPSIEIVGGEPLFLPEPGGVAINGPVFPRGRGCGPEFRVQACCEKEVRLEIRGPDGKMIDQPELTEHFSGYYTATWSWTSTSGWSVPGDIPIGKYTVVAKTGCDQRDGQCSFYVIFDPDEVNGPARFSFDSTAIWFGTGANSIRGLHYYLHLGDARVFETAIAAASGMTDSYQAAIEVARAEEDLFTYSLNYHTQDVVDLIVNYTEAQCADDACCLTALLRSIGIPAHPVTADAGLETGVANWTFDTWVEFLATLGGLTDWRILHPHQYPGMQPESRATFGANRGVASKGFNDVIVMANENWVAAQLDDAGTDVTYSRNECSEPGQHLTAAPWIGELCEAGYWVNPHWDCTGVRAERLIIGDRGFRFSEYDLRFSGRIGGSLDVVNPSPERSFGRIVLELVTSRIEEKAFVDETLGETALSSALDPGELVTIPFSFKFPETIAPGRNLYLRARLDERTIALHEVHIRPSVDIKLDISSELIQGEEATIRVVVHNQTEDTLRDVRISLHVPFALRVTQGRSLRPGTLHSGEVKDTAWSVHAVCPLVSGSIQAIVATANGGGAIASKHVSVLGETIEGEAPRPGLTPERR